MLNAELWLYSATNMVQKKCNTLKLTSYVNGVSPFRAGFVFLFSSTVASLSASLSSLADNLVVFAFYALAIGVVLHFLCNFSYQKANQIEVI